MVYFLGDWGMGDSEYTTCQNVAQIQDYKINNHHHQNHHHHNHHLNNKQRKQQLQQHNYNHQQQIQQRQNKQQLNQLHHQYQLEKQEKKHQLHKNIFQATRSNHGLFGSNNKKKLTQDLDHLQPIDNNNLNEIQNYENDDDDEIALHPLNSQVSTFIPSIVNSAPHLQIHSITQVGGHTRLLMLNHNTVIKPLNLRELEFYMNIPNEIKMFVPSYKGESILLPFI